MAFRTLPICQSQSGRFGTLFIFPYIGNNHPNWLSYFSEGWPNHQPAVCLSSYFHMILGELTHWSWRWLMCRSPSSYPSKGPVTPLFTRVFVRSLGKPMPWTILSWLTINGRLTYCGWKKSDTSWEVVPIISRATIRNWAGFRWPIHRIYIYIIIFTIPKFVGFRFVILGTPISSSGYRTMGFSMTSTKTSELGATPIDPPTRKNGGFFCGWRKSPGAAWGSKRSVGSLNVVSVLGSTWSKNGLMVI